MDADELCEFCQKERAMYEVWLRPQRNWVNEGTASAGLLQLRQVCKTCLENPEIRRVNNRRLKATVLSLTNNGRDFWGRFTFGPSLDSQGGI